MSAHSHAHDDHSRGHAHEHSHGAASFGRAFAIGILLNLGFVIVETIAGFRANSIALVADAGHNMSDVLGLVVAWGGSWLAQMAPSARFSYGFKKASILLGADQRLGPSGRYRSNRRRGRPPVLPPVADPRADGDHRCRTWNPGQRHHRLAVRQGTRARHQYPGRLPAHGVGRSGVACGGLRRIRHPVDRARMGRPRDEPRRCSGHPVEHLRPSQGIRRNDPCGGPKRHRRRGSAGRARTDRGGRDRPRPSCLAAKHDRNRADRAYRHRPGGRSRWASRNCPDDSARALPDRALHHPGRAQPSGASPGLLEEPESAAAG